MKRPTLTLVFRILVTAAALIWFISAVRPASLLDRLAHVRWPVVALAFLVNAGWVVPSAFRWKGVARAAGYRLPFRAAVRLYVIGSFFGAFLPTGNGGDVVRGLLASRGYGFPVGGMLGTVLVERIIGVTVSLCLVLIAGLLHFTRPFMPRNVLVSAAVLLGCICAAGALLVSGRFRNLLKALLRKVPFRPFREGTTNAGRVMDACVRDPRALGSALLLSLANQCFPILSGFVASLAIPDFRAPLYAFLAVMPLSFVSVLLPSIGGYGVREAGYILFFGWFGVPAGPSAVFGIIRLLSQWLFALGGAVLYISGRRDETQRGVQTPMKWMKRVTGSVG